MIVNWSAAGVPKTGRDSIYSVYPAIYDGAPWLELEHQFEGVTDWRLYRIRGAPGVS